MAPIGFRKTFRWFVGTAIGSVTVVASLALAGTPGGVWLTAGGPAERAAPSQDLAHKTPQTLRFTQVGAKDGLTPISAEVRGVPRAEQAVPMRGSGSIRADIARYNEERSIPRPQSRPSDDSRAPSNATYRN
ncbi:hypothetical protein [Caballeronia humi]|uniref:Peptide-binding protein n=1 Tax=Caballeronia humi TaxID=326474 RepID=A0A158IIC7_9BURK|nr:hypothetical protein [Caballeronia humi]SAL56304.1 peptide-binding protein [Caballeronia humi]